jgi:hypothetical protein
MLSETQYLPCIDFFISVLKHGSIMLESQEFYQKQSYRNRCYIAGSNKIEVLTIPIIHQRKTPITECKIDYATRWWAIHLHSIRSAYGKSPFFEHYYSDIECIILKKNPLLWELNLELMTLCLKKLKIDFKIDTSKIYEKQLENKGLDLREKIHPKKTYLNSDSIALLRYHQTFGNKFEKNLSVIDLLFNEGNNSKLLLDKIITKKDTKE